MTGKKDVTNTIRNFYTKLYTGGRNSLETILSRSLFDNPNIPTLKEESQLLEEKITRSEIF